MIRIAKSPDPRRLALLIIGTTLVITVTAAPSNVDPRKPTQLEVLQLPAYCHKQFGLASAVPMPTEQCGVWMNHFCGGLVALNRAGNPATKKKGHELTRARRSIDYTKRGMEAGCPLAGEVEAAEKRLQMLETLAR